MGWGKENSNKQTNKNDHQIKAQDNEVTKTEVRANQTQVQKVKINQS